VNRAAEASRADSRLNSPSVLTNVTSHTEGQIAYPILDRLLDLLPESPPGHPGHPQQLRFCQLILGIPARRVNRWLRSVGRSVWDRRRKPPPLMPLEADRLVAGAGPEPLDGFPGTRGQNATEDLLLVAVPPESGGGGIPQERLDGRR
jgi:hypothetical protein